MPIARRHRLGTRISALVLALVAAAIALPTTLVVADSCRTLRVALVDAARSSARLVALSSSEALAGDDVDALRTFVANYSHENPDVQRALFTDKDGRVIAHSQPEMEGQQIEALHPPPKGEVVGDGDAADGSEELVVDVPVLISGEPFGTFETVTSLAAIDTAARHAIGRAAWIALLLLVGGALAARRVARSIAAPITALSTAAVDFAAAPREMRMRLERPDEIGLLAGAFDSMTTQVLAQRDALRAHSDELEKSVEERTAQLRRTETLLRAMSECSPVAMLVISAADGGVLYANRRFAQLWHLEGPLLDPIGLDWNLRLRPLLIGRLGNDREAVEVQLQKLGNGIDGAVPASHAGELRLADGRILRTEAVPVIDAAGAALGRLHVFEDVTEAKRVASALERARDEALAAARLKSEFLANMSHEIRTPMNGVLGFVEMLAATKLDAQQRDYLDTVRSSGESLLTILNDILDFSKIEAGRMTLEEIEFSPRELIDGTAALLAAKAQEKGLTFLAPVAPTVPERLRGDPTRLRQIVSNLAGNAIKFTERGEVAIEASGTRRADGGFELVVSVRDSGIGITAEAQAKLFQAFMQADGSTTRRFGGTGLGLVISRRLAQAMGGSLEIESAVGHGSRFTLRVVLPCVADSPAPPRPDALRDVAIVVVDGCSAERAVAVELLEAAGARVSQAADASAALELARRATSAGQPFRLALIDLPIADPRDVSGGESPAAATMLVRDPALAATVRVGMSTLKSAASERPERSAVDALVSKPLRRDSLLNALVALLDAKRPSVTTSLASSEGPDVRERAKEPVVAPMSSPDAGVSRDPRVAAPGAASELAQIAVGRRLLLAEDHPVNQKLATLLLKRTGAEVVVAGDGRAAVAAWSLGGIDLILMDVQMPELDGLAATAAIRAREAPGEHVPIVALTANAMSGDRERFLAAGMDDYLSKPLRPADLVRVLCRHLGRTSASDPVATTSLVSQAPSARLDP